MDTIKSSEDISHLFTHGKRIHTPYLTFIVLKAQHDRSFDEAGRVAFIAGKKLGNAVWRNSAKRRMRAICRDLHGPWGSYQVVFLAKASLLTASYSKVLTVCDETLRRFGIIR